MDLQQEVTDFKPFIETYTGKHFYLDKPEFSINDIAHSLANTCRYNGHCNTFYSVSEHSILVASIMEEWMLGNPLEGLLHDASEAYLADVPRPWKDYLSDYNILEKGLDFKIRAHFGLQPKESTWCKTADWCALFIEAKDLMKSEGAAFTFPPGIPELVKELHEDIYISCLDPADAEDAFLCNYERYMSRVRD